MNYTDDFGKYRHSVRDVVDTAINAFDLAYCNPGQSQTARVLTETGEYIIVIARTTRNGVQGTQWDR